MKKTIEIDSLVEYIRKLGGTADKEGKLNFPKSLGTGYLKLIKPLPQMAIMLQHYEINHPLAIIRKEQEGGHNTLIFSFRNLAIAKVSSRQPAAQFLSSVQVSTFDVRLDIEVPAHFETRNLIIGVEIDFLKELLAGYGNNQVMERMMNREQSCLYEAIISPKIQAVASEIFQADATAALADCFYRIKAEELIYCFLAELLRREEVALYPINQDDIKSIYAIRNKIIDDLETPPQLEQLSRDANMSVSKMGRLFRQIFGDSIYNYYQKIRMQHAAALLREQKLSVSEVGYRLGFANLSHFGRLFERHIGMKPKEYSKSKL